MTDLERIELGWAVNKILGDYHLHPSCCSRIGVCEAIVELFHPTPAEAADDRTTTPHETENAT